VAVLTVMTWNVQNLFAPATTDRLDADAYQAKLAALAGLIDQVAPDVLAVQEIGADPVLADLAAACTTKFEHYLAGVPDGRGIRVGLLSTRRFVRNRDITPIPRTRLAGPDRRMTTPPARQAAGCCRARSASALSR